MKSDRRHQYKHSEKCCRENYRCFSFPSNDSSWQMTSFYSFVLCFDQSSAPPLTLWNKATENAAALSTVTVVILPSGRAVAGSSAVNSNGRWWVLWVCRVHRTGCHWCSGTGPPGQVGSGRWNMWNTVGQSENQSQPGLQMRASVKAYYVIIEQSVEQIYLCLHDCLSSGGLKKVELTVNSNMRLSLWSH